MIDEPRIAALTAVGLAGVGLSIAWLPGLRHHAVVAFVARLLLTAGLVVAILDFGELGGVLGLALAAMAAAVSWDGQPPPQVPRPSRKEILLASAVTALGVYAALRGWWLLGLVPEPARQVSALVVGSVGALAVVAIADRARVRMREAVRERFGR
ncbi:MAG: hypothetical protein ICV70_06745 [Jiangellaceae bacterium]|nr:hypothetical protein [Jiangellaceae bacterium]